MGKLSVVRCQNEKGEPAIGVLLSRDAIFQTPQGDPQPGLSLTPALARLAAYSLLFFAQEIENGGVPDPQNAISFQGRPN